MANNINDIRNGIPVLPKN